MQEDLLLVESSHQDNLKEMMQHMITSEDFADVTIVSDDKKYIKAHKVILSACSPFLKSILQMDTNNAMIFLEGIQYAEIETLLQFVYFGVATLSEERVNDIISVLQIEEPSNWYEDHHPHNIPDVSEDLPKGNHTDELVGGNLVNQDVVKKKRGRPKGWRKNKHNPDSSVLLAEREEDPLMFGNSGNEEAVKKKRGRPKGWRKQKADPDSSVLLAEGEDDQFEAVSNSNRNVSNIQYKPDPDTSELLAEDEQYQIVSDSPIPQQQNNATKSTKHENLTGKAVEPANTNLKERENFLKKHNQYIHETDPSLKVKMITVYKGLKMVRCKTKLYCVQGCGSQFVKGDACKRHESYCTFTAKYIN